MEIGETITIRKTGEEKMYIEGKVLESESIEELDELENMLSTLYWHISFKKAKLEEMK